MIHIFPGWLDKAKQRFSSDEQDFDAQDFGHTLTGDTWERIDTVTDNSDVETPDKAANKIQYYSWGASNKAAAAV